jgi:hypothetical protein
MLDRWSIDENDWKMADFEFFLPAYIAKTLDLANQRAYMWITKHITPITRCNALKA